MAADRIIREIKEAIESAQPADGGADSLDAARRLREAAEAFEREMVKSARKAGLSWTQIGAVYGLTKQGAQQRFRDGEATAPRRSRKQKAQPAIISESARD